MCNDADQWVRVADRIVPTGTSLPPFVRFGSKADKPSQAKINRCPLLSESGHFSGTLVAYCFYDVGGVLSGLPCKSQRISVYSQKVSLGLRRPTHELYFRVLSPYLVNLNRPFSLTDIALWGSISRPQFLE